MECEQVESHSDKDETLEEHLDSCCEYYMSIGVPYDVFWHGDYCALKYYEAVYLQQRKIQNENMWMQGCYNFIAHSTTLANSFRGKGGKAQEYLDKPLDFFGKSEREEKAEAEAAKRRIIENLNRFKQEWEKHNVANNSEFTNKHNG